MPGPLTRGQQAGSVGVLDREAYFNAAYQLLADGGSGEVTMAALCRRLNVTNGSFYHHFTDMPTFVVAFADRWKQGVLAWHAECAEVANPLRRHELITNQSLDYLFTDGEAAVRAWANSHPAFAAALGAVHRSADEVAIRTYEQILGDPDLARLLHAFAACTVAGLSLRADRDLARDRLLAVFLELGRRSVGVETGLAEVDGRPQFRFLDARTPDLPPDEPRAVADYRGVTWLHGDRWRVDSAPTSTGRGRGRDAYLATARQILAVHGPAGLTIQAVCRALEVTKGSFYWHFADMAGFVEAVATDWELFQNARLAAGSQEPDSLATLQALFQQMLELPDPAEKAIRAWGRTEAAVEDRLRRIDRRRHEVFAAAIGGVADDAAADVLADAMLGMSIGLHQSAPGFDAATAVRIVLAFARRYLRIDAEILVVDHRPVVACKRWE